MKGKPIWTLVTACLFLVLLCGPVGWQVASGRGSTIGHAFIQPAADAASPVPSQTFRPNASTPPAQLAGVSIHSGAQGKTVIDIRTNAPVRFRPLILRHPYRLVIDLEETEARHAERIPSPLAGVVKDVRLAQFQVAPTEVTRVVADLTADSPFQIENEPQGVRVVIGGEPHQAVSSARPSLAHPEITASATRSLEKAVTLRPVSLPLLSAYPPKAAVDLTQPVEVNLADLKKPESNGQLSTEPQASPGNDSHSARTEAPKMVAAIQPLDSSPSVPESPQVLQSMAGDSGVSAGALRQSGIISTPFYSRHHYTGKLISLDLRDVDIRDFFRLIHRVSGLNIVVDSDVTGRITMVMDDVPWDEALDLALKDNGLATQFEGNVLRIAKVSTLDNEAKAQADARAAKLAAEPLVTVVRPLKYARAADQLPGQAGAMSGPGGGAPLTIPGVVTILNGLKGVISPDGKVMADPRDNAVIITDHRSQIPIIEAVIDKLDTKSKQVSIQVRVILANADFTRTLSSVLSGAFMNHSGTTQTAAGTGNGIVGTAATSSPLPLLGAVTQPSTVSATGFGAFAITNAGARYAINAAITAAETRDQARTISRPTIVTQNNVRGEVQQGVQIPLQMNINNTITVQYVNATLQLSVTPQVTIDGKIFLNIYVNNASVGTFSTLVGPSINTQEATTQVLVPDGGTVVFGGINVTTRSRSATYIPLLGSIPVLGNLFKSSSINDENQELLFFVSPTILPG